MSKKDINYGDGFEQHISKLDIDEKTKDFLYSIADQLDEYFWNDGKYWYDSIEFKFSHFTGFQPYIKDIRKNCFYCPSVDGPLDGNCKVS